MEFCDKCGGILVLKKTKKGVEYACRICGKKYSKGSKIKISEKVSKEGNIRIVEQRREELPITEIVCSKCGNKEAYWWLQQTRAIDEPPTRFYKCTKCNHTWREYS
jgi:DNA-directed RNA polymerase subunit M